MFTLSKHPYRLMALLLLPIVAGGLLWFYLRTPPLVAHLDEPFTLQMNQRAEFADAELRVTWAGVIDGRCSQCTANLGATVFLSVQVAGQPPTEQTLVTQPFRNGFSDTSTNISPPSPPKLMPKRPTTLPAPIAPST